MPYSTELESGRCFRKGGSIFGTVFVLKDSKKISQQKINFSSARTLHQIANYWSERYRLEPVQLLSHLEGYGVNALEEVEEREARSKQSAVAEPVELSAGRRSSALDLLHSPDLLFLHKEICRNRGVVREEPAVLTVIFAGTSRLLPDPVNLMLCGQSSSGKSITAGRALQMFPPEVKVERWGLSKQALVYTDEVLKHKIIFISEYAGAEAADHAIRCIQSEHSIVFEVVFKDRETGEFTTKPIIKEGPAAFIMTTTEMELDLQNETRQWRIFTDESPQQTVRVIRTQCNQLFNPMPTLEDLQVFQDAQRILEQLPVTIQEPLATLITNGMLEQNASSLPIRARRDYPRLLGAVQVSALLHQFQRPRNALGCVVADIRDYYHTWRAIANIFAESLTGVTTNVMSVYNVLKEREDESGGAEPLSVNEIATAIGPHADEKTVKNWIHTARSHGIVERVGIGQPLKYQAVRLPGAIQLPDPNDLVAQMPNLNHVGPLIDPISGEEVSF